MMILKIVTVILGSALAKDLRVGLLRGHQKGSFTMPRIVSQRHYSPPRCLQHLCFILFKGKAQLLVRQRGRRPLLWPYNAVRSCDERWSIETLEPQLDK